MLWPVAWQCSKMRKWQNIRGLVFFDPGTREGTGRFGHDQGGLAARSGTQFT